MADPTKAEPRNPTYGGETAQDSVDRMAGKAGNPPHPSADYTAPKKFVGPKIQPNAPGGKSYGAPLGSTILK